jgi:hypothetical protein
MQFTAAVAVELVLAIYIVAVAWAAVEIASW